MLQVDVEDAGDIDVGPDDGDMTGGGVGDFTKTGGWVLLPDLTGRSLHEQVCMGAGD